MQEEVNEQYWKRQRREKSERSSKLKERSDLDEKRREEKVETKH